MSIWFSTSLKYDLNLLKFLSPMLPEESKINTTSAGSLQPVHSQAYTGYILILGTYQMIKGLTEKNLVISGGFRIYQTGANPKEGRERQPIQPIIW